MRSIEILSCAAQCTVQDLGRFGYLSLGVGTSGAADRGSFRLANRLVGNVEAAAAIECLLGGLSIRINDPVLAAVTGAPAQAFVNDTPVGPNSTLRLSAGDILALAVPRSGLRTYVALRGGIGVQPVLGSRSTDTLSGIGPSAMSAGDVLPLGQDAGDYPAIEVAPVRTITGDPLTLGVILGPRDDWFTNPQELVTATWMVSSQSDRIGIRLDAQDGQPPLHRLKTAELPSEGVVLGAIQIPPSGQPVIFLADHPVSGGYPVIGVVCESDVDRAAQARPGQHISFAFAAGTATGRGEITHQRRR